ncbi:MAG: alpha/beta hydrolase [Nitriliruptorales bacterium]|nr:alpha/beta hydrolase [Nitriliruptorales bacterium]
MPGGDTRFFVRVLGHGDHLAMLLHGWPEDGTCWRAVAPLLADAGYRVACPDLKGFGKSEAPKKGYDPETLADEISQLIKNLHVKKALLVGHDWGGAVALATAFRHPGRVRALVTMSSPYRQIDLKKSWHIPAMNLPVVPELAFKVAPRQLVTATLRYASVVKEPFTREVVDHYTESITAAPSAWLSYYRTLSRQAVRERVSRQVRRRVGMLNEPSEPNRLRVPALVIWGEEDPATPHSLAPQVAADLEGDLVSIPGVGHFVPEEDPLAVARAIVRHAGEVPADREVAGA